MSREWKPGDLAVVTWQGDQYRAVRDSKGWDVLDETIGFFFDSDVSEVRPLVVIDPEDREQVETFALALGRQPLAQNPNRENVQAALRSLVADPKPEEPTGLGAVVSNSNGDHWVYTGLRDDDDARWWYHGLNRLKYRAIDAVEVLSPGVQP